MFSTCLASLFVDALESRQFLSASSNFEIGPPPTNGGHSSAAHVLVLSPAQSDTGTPHVTVVVTPAADKAPPIKEIVVTKHVDISTPKMLE